MDHKGNIAITILVLGVFAVCSLALLSFYSSTLNIDNSFVRIDIVKQAKVFEKEIIFEESQGKIFKKWNYLKRVLKLVMLFLMLLKMKIIILLKENTLRINGGG